MLRMLSNARKVNHPSNPLYQDVETLQRAFVTRVQSLCEQMRIESNVTNYTIEQCERELADERKLAEKTMDTSGAVEEGSTDGSAPVGEKLENATTSKGKAYAVGEYIYITNRTNPKDPAHIGRIEQLWMKGEELCFRLVEEYFLSVWLLCRFARS